MCVCERTEGQKGRRRDALCEKSKSKSQLLAVDSSDHPLPFFEQTLYYTILYFIQGPEMHRNSARLMLSRPAYGGMASHFAGTNRSLEPDCSLTLLCNT